MIKEQLITIVDSRQEQLINLCSQLVRIPSETPPSDTRKIANFIVEILKQVEGAEISLPVMEEPIVNIIARLKGNGDGKQLVFNGHLDTFPVGDRSEWTMDPLGGIKDGRLFGRGVCDMKAGVAASIFAFMLMAECRDAWSGEIVLTLVGDEERGGIKGTKFIVETFPDIRGDAMISGDAGSPMVLRFGEKGYFRFELNAIGKSGHGAHVHKGINAIDRLIEGMSKINQYFRKISVTAPEKVTKAILQSSEVSERYSGKGETEVLQSVTVNFGVIDGGISPNLIPAKASAKGDIRLPVGITIAEVEEKLKEIVDSIEGLSYNMLNAIEPNWSEVEHEIFSLSIANGHRVMGESPVVTMRVGSSDARYYRFKDVPSVNCGLTPYNMGAPDEYIEIKELIDVAKIHVLTAFDYLSK